MCAHDQNPESDQHEHGIGSTWGGRSRRSISSAHHARIWAPRSIFSGDTSIAYAGLSLPLLAQSNWFLNGSVGAALHDGPLQKGSGRLPALQRLRLWRAVMPLFTAELGYRLTDEAAISLVYAHMSHEGIIPGRERRA